MKCENCLHCEVCTFARQYRGVNKCPDFADNDLCIKLPCKVGTKVYAIASLEMLRTAMEAVETPEQMREKPLWKECSEEEMAKLCGLR